MVCCALLAAFIAAVLWLPGLLTPHAGSAGNDPLAWRLHGGPSIEYAKPPPPASFTISARLKSVGYAVEGLRFMVRNEHNARVHLAASIFVVPAGIAVGIEAADWRWIAVAIAWVWFAEAMNTAFEHLCDVVCRERNDHVRIAKDVAAGAVFVSAAGAVILGMLTFLPYIVPAASGIGADLVICRSGS